MGFQAAFLLRCSKNLLESANIFQNARHLSNKSVLITKIHRKHYLKQYKTLMVQPDGSTFTFRHHEPRSIVKMPVNLSTLSEEERAYYLEKRKPKKKVTIEDEIEINFSSEKYLKLIKKKV